MASESAITAAIENVVGQTSNKYSIWTIGVTDDPASRKGQHGNPGSWMHWNADSESAARNVEKHFLAKGMKGGTGGGGKADYVYIF